MNAFPFGGCPHCGGVLAPAEPIGRGVIPPELRDALDVMMRPATIHAAILRKLTRHFGEEVLAANLIDAVYGASGGPLTVRNTMRVHISRLRGRLRPLGLIVVGTRYPAGYRLERGPHI